MHSISTLSSMLTAMIYPSWLYAGVRLHVGQHVVSHDADASHSTTSMDVCIDVSLRVHGITSTLLVSSYDLLY